MLDNRDRGVLIADGFDFATFDPICWGHVPGCSCVPVGSGYNCIPACLDYSADYGSAYNLAPG